MCLWLFFFLCILLLVLVCIYLFPVTSLLSAFILYLFWLCFSKTIRLIHCFHPLKNPCKREESLLGILFSGSQTSFSRSLSYSLLFVISSYYHKQTSGKSNRKLDGWLISRWHFSCGFVLGGFFPDPMQRISCIVTLSDGRMGRLGGGSFMLGFGWGDRGWVSYFS